MKKTKLRNNFLKNRTEENRKKIHQANRLKKPQKTTTTTKKNKQLLQY